MDAEQNKLDIEKTLEDYSWAAVIVPKSKKGGIFMLCHLMLMRRKHLSLSNPSVITLSKNYLISYSP